MVFGIDFGTSRTVAAFSEDGEYTVCRFNCNGKLREYIPSLIAVKDGSIQFGWDAVACENEPGVYLIRSLKRMVGYYPPDLDIELAPDVHISVLDLAALFMAHVKKMLINASGPVVDADEPIEVMIATPANANTNQRYITMEAFKKAGFMVKGMLNEPTATALEFSHRYLKRPGIGCPEPCVAVYDLGGGTFDASVFELADKKYNVITHEGISRLGGDDIDMAILELVLQKLNMQRKELSRSDEVRLLEECRRTKEGTSRMARKLAIDVGHVFDKKKKVLLDKQDIYDRCKPIVRQSVDTLETAIKTAELMNVDPGTKRKLEAIYVAGGSVGFPLVRSMLNDHFGKKVRISPCPQDATAAGLAIGADRKRSAHLSEAVSRNLGVWRENGSNKIFDTLIEKSRRLKPQSGSIQVKRTYNPIHNLGHLRFVECSAIGRSGEPSGDIADIKEIFFPYDPQLKNEEDLCHVPVIGRPDLAAQEVSETYSYDSRGIITVEVENLSARYKRTYILSRRCLPAELSADE